MRKFVSSGFVLIILLLATASCKDDVVAYGDLQLPVSQLAGELPDVVITFEHEDFLEMGCSFEIVENGQISQLCLLLPDNGVYRVTLWDLDEMQVITSIHMEVIARQTKCMEIVPHLVEAGDRVAVTLYTNDWYWYLAEHDGPLYPATFGDIQILNFASEVNPSGLVVPANYNFFALGGLVDIAYQPEL